MNEMSCEIAQRPRALGASLCSIPLDEEGRLSNLHQIPEADPFEESFVHTGNFGIQQDKKIQAGLSFLSCKYSSPIYIDRDPELLTQVFNQFTNSSSSNINSIRVTGPKFFSPAIHLCDPQQIPVQRKSIGTPEKREVYLRKSRSSMKAVANNALIDSPLHKNVTSNKLVITRKETDSTVNQIRHFFNCLKVPNVKLNQEHGVFSFPGLFRSDDQRPFVTNMSSRRSLSRQALQPPLNTLVVKKVREALAKLSLKNTRMSRRDSARIAPTKIEIDAMDHTFVFKPIFIDTPPLGISIINGIAALDNSSNATLAQIKQFFSSEPPSLTRYAQHLELISGNFAVQDLFMNILISRLTKTSIVYFGFESIEQSVRKLKNLYNPHQESKRKLSKSESRGRKKKRVSKIAFKWNSEDESEDLEDEDCDSDTDNNLMDKRSSNFVDHDYDYDQLYSALPRKAKSSTNTRKTRLSAPWGKIAQNALQEWSGPIELRELYAKKSFATTGLLYDAGKENYEGKRKFKFELPSFYGDSILNTVSEFELSYDIKLFYETTGGSEKMKQLLSGPTKFVRIKKNIFVDRKPRKNLENTTCHCADGGEEEDYWELDNSGSTFIKTRKAVGCGENCINRCMFYECDDNCPLKEKCTNRTFQRKDDIKGLQICHSSGRGFGLKTPNFIPRGKLVCEYRGEIISQDTCSERMNTMYKDLENYYFLEYASGEVLDGCRKGTEARFVNHSCDPNCHIEKWTFDGEYHIGVFSSKDIEPGSEITYDYRFKSFGPLQRCNCGSENCRGFIGVNKKDEKPGITTLASILYPAPKKASLPKRGLSRVEEVASPKYIYKDDDDEEEIVKPKKIKSKEKSVFTIATRVMIPHKIVYITSSKMKAHFRTSLCTLKASQELYREMNIFLPRNARDFLKLEVLFVGAKLPHDFEAPKRISSVIIQRRKRSIEEIILELKNSNLAAAQLFDSLSKSDEIVEKCMELDNSVMELEQSIVGADLVNTTNIKQLKQGTPVRHNLVHAVETTDKENRLPIY